MKPELADTPVDRNALVKYLKNLQYTKCYLASTNAAKDSSIGMSFDTGYMVAVTELLNKIENYKDLNDFDEQYSPIYTETDEDDIDE